MIKIVVVDDSAFMRKALQLMLESDPSIKVVSMARDGEEGVDQVRKHRPDLVTMDIEMPRMDGLAALEIIMREHPVPVLVVSSLTTEGAEMTLDALDKGAVDFIPKTQSFVAIDITQIRDGLLMKVKAIVANRASFNKVAKSKMRAAKAQPTGAPPPISVTIPAALAKKQYGVVAIGVSTGGPPVVQHMVENLDKDFPVGIVIAQHMPATFTKAFADRLDKLTPLEVREAEEGDTITKGTVLIGKGGRHVAIKRVRTQGVIDLTQNPPGLLYHPSADILFSSVVRVYGSRTLGMILTGMGQDGLNGLRELDAGGGTIVAQDKESCVVYGMPKAAVDAGIADIVAPGNEMPVILKQLVH